MDENLEILWGAKAIGAFIRQKPRAAYHLLETGQIPGRKIGDIWSSPKTQKTRSRGG